MRTVSRPSEPREEPRCAVSPSLSTSCRQLAPATDADIRPPMPARTCTLAAPVPLMHRALVRIQFHWNAAYTHCKAIGLDADGMTVAASSIELDAAVRQE